MSFPQEKNGAESRLYRLNRLHRVLSGIGGAVVRMRGRQELFDAVCRIVVEDGLLRMVFIAEVDAAARVARSAASFGVGQEYLGEPTSVIPADGGPLSMGTVGTAMRSGVYDFCNDIPGTPRMKPWHETTQAHGFLSNASFPIKINGTTVAVLVLYAGEANYFLDDEIQLMVAVADSLSFALESQEKERLRIEADSALRESEERFRGMFAAAGTGIAISTPDGRYLQVNAAYCQMLGYTEDELLKRNFASLTHPEDLPLNLKFRDELLAGSRKNFVMEKRYINKNGAVVWTRHSVAAIHDAVGATESLIVVAEDITERKRGEARFMRLNRLHTVLSRTGEVIVRARDRRGLYDAVCRIVVEDGHLRMVFIAEVDALTKVARPAASYGAGQECVHELTGVIPADGRLLGLGTVGTAIGSGTYDFCNDIAGTPAMKPWHETTQTHGLLANASFPIKVNGATVSVLVLYAGEVDYFLDDEIQLMMAVANSLSFALEAQEREWLRKVSEKALRESEERFRLITNLVPHGIFAKNAAGRHIFANSALAELAGLSVEDILGKNDFELVADKAQAEAFRADDQAVIQSGEKMVISEEPRTDLSGRTRLLQTIKIPFSLAETGERAVLGICMDITERKRAEARFRRLVNSNMQGVIFWNKKGEVTGGNDAFLELVGYTRGDIEAGRINWNAMTPPEYAGLDQRALEQIADKGVCIPYEKEWIRKDGSRVPILIGATVFEDNPEEGICFVVDLSEHRKIEKQFLQVQKMQTVGTLAGGIAHDLNNILAPIIMSADLLKMDVTDPEQLDLLETIKLSGKRGSEMVRQILAFARGFDGEKILVDVGQVVGELKRILEDTFPKNVGIEVSSEPGLWSVLADPSQLNQVVLNLCVNARDAMPDGGGITIQMRNQTLDNLYVEMNPGSKPGNYILIKVTDTGGGIPREIKDKIFDPFFTTKEVGKGTGLGLSTVLGIVKSLGGFINLYSEMGRGATFKVYLPAKASEAEKTDNEIEPSALPRGKGEMILVVDDEEVIRMTVKRTLERFGYRVQTAQHGAEAVALYSKPANTFSAVITDMSMPIMDGPSTIMALKSMDPQVVIIGSSGFHVDMNMEKAVAAGVEYFIPKPYTAEAILRTLRQAIDHPRSKP